MTTTTTEPVTVEGVEIEPTTWDRWCMAHRVLDCDADDIAQYAAEAKLPQAYRVPGVWVEVRVVHRDSEAVVVEVTTLTGRRDSRAAAVLARDWVAIDPATVAAVDGMFGAAS